MQPVTVSTLNDQIKYLVETTFVQVVVEGEISRPTYHGSGHIYFSIKDKDAQVKAVMFRGNASKLKFRLEDGMKVILFGAVTVYKPRGEYQINVATIEAAGIGNLSLAFSQLKEKLANLGYFKEEKKIPKPDIIDSIVIITSATGAALQDMLRLIAKRWPMVKITLIDVLVQGEQASMQISNAIRYADTLNADTIIVSRGGGSIEDLWAFNEENVATALFNARTFSISAVGHEIDWVISDYVADIRAATPTAAIEILLPDQWEKTQYIDQLKATMSQKMGVVLSQKIKLLDNFSEQFSRYSIDRKLIKFSQEIKELQARFVQLQYQNLNKNKQELLQIKEGLIRQSNIVLQQKVQQIMYLEKNLHSLDPKHRDKNGYVQLSKEGKLINLDAVSIGETITLATSRFKSEATISSKVSL